MEHKILIVIVSYNACHLMQENIESIRRTLPAGCCQIAVTDNASEDGVTEWLSEQSDIILVKNSHNAGFGPACNQAVKAAGEAYADFDIFLLNNDTRLADNAVLHLQEALYQDELTGAAGSVSNYAGNRQQLDAAFDSVEDYLRFGRELNLTAENSTEERVRLSGFAMLIKRALWDEIGGFDEDFAPGYFEDDALSMEILRRGYRLKLVKNSFIYHAGSQSFSKIDYQTLLTAHHTLFIKKYGFDILDHAYPNEAVIAQIPFNRGDSFSLLQVGCGLGAELKAVRSAFPESQVAGYEPRPALYDIVKHTEEVYPDIASLTKAYPEKHFQVLLIDPNLIGRLRSEEKASIVGTCYDDAALLSKNAAYENFPYEKIKLIIWDMDDTLWQGTLSEGAVTLPEANAALIKSLADHGIVNSISSKNDAAPVEKELEKAGIAALFVFNNINWEDKGDQIAEKVKRMGLRNENVLFIDDHPRNLEEAAFAAKGLMTAAPDILPYLAEYYGKLLPGDLSHERLKQYQLLEKKTEAQSVSSSKEQFLYDSDIRISIHKNCLEELDRIHEMVQRTNQLNFTKNRDHKALLTKLLTNDWNDCGYVKVRDRFGDYGIVGFFCYNEREKSMEHFLFSCRVLGMGIEQFVYNRLGCPDFPVKEPVAATLAKEKETPWIKEDTGEEIREDKAKSNRVRILLKGPCDMSAIEPYLTGGSITTEFNYINDKGFATTGQNHTMHIYESATLSAKELSRITEEVPFIIDGDFKTKLFTDSYHIICLSLLQDLSAGLYRNKETGAYISFSSRNFDLTAPLYQARFIRGEIQGHEFPFTQEILDAFSEKWEFVGATPLDLLLRNLDFIYENVPGNPLMILLLGSETDYQNNTEEFAGLCEVYREVNPVIKAFAEDHDRIRVIDPTDFIHSQEDFEDCINHFSRNVYYEIAGRVCEYINETVEKIAAKRSPGSTGSAGKTGESENGPESAGTPSGKTENRKRMEIPEDYNSVMFDGFRMPPGFFVPEKRSDFLVDERRKKIWAVEIDLVCRFDRFCRQHGLTYYADNGTLLGAVRHGGFIPWDDDMDFVMMRPEFERLKQLASLPGAFEEPYCFQLSEEIDGLSYTSSFARLRNRRTSAIEFYDAPKQRNQGIFIDIFVFDDAGGEGNRSEINWNTKLELWYAVTNPEQLLALAAKGQTNLDHDTVKSLAGIRPVDRVATYEDFCLRTFGRTEKIKVIQDHTPPMPRAYFDGLVYLPFEHIMLPAPLRYDAVLRARYGNYMQPVHAPAQHIIADMDPDRPYEYYLEQTI
ncbi:MAG: HAD-IIIC family phosphatase [Lachnospiraceae bacterium]|nr:HAD-IIIC family phosphatase [Lachnospiraceae bacterium]